MIRIAILLVVAVLAALFAFQAAENPGYVEAGWGGVVIETTALFAVIAMVLFTAALLPALRFLMMVIDAPGRLFRANERRKREKGLEALALGLIAAEAGEFAEAQRRAQEASDLVEEPRLAKLLEARAAEVAGDVPAAERAYAGMLLNEDTEILGRKGLLQAALQRGDRTQALAHAEAALRLSKTATWPFQTVFELRVQGADWEGALSALEEAEKRRLVEPAVARRRRAVLFSAAAHKEERERHVPAAAELAERAVRIAADFPPAATLAARLLVMDGKSWKAQAVLEEAWETAPHPALAQAYRDLKSGETPEERRRRMMSLVELKPEHRESKLIAAELALERGDFSGALHNLDHAFRENPSSRVCNLYAAVHRSRGDEEAARRWLGQAAVAPREADWSDLDPEGPAFLYDEQDWARMVYAYGDSGQLIHPRMERGGRDVGAGSVLALPPALRGPPIEEARAWAQQGDAA